MTTGCEASLSRIEKLADGEASPSEAREAEAHLERCPSCREHFEALTALAKLSRESLPPEPPESYWEHLPRKILERIDSETASSSGSLLRKLLAPEMLRWQALAASLILLTAVGVSVFRAGLFRADQPRPPLPAPKTAAPEVPEQIAPLETEPPPMARDEPAKAQRKRPQAPLPAALPSPAEAPPPEVSVQEDAAAELATVAGAPDRVASGDTREDDDFLVLKQEEEREEKEKALGSRAAANRALSVSSAEDSRSDTCAGWRRFLETYGEEGTRGTDARYELARCSLRRYEEEPVGSARESAIADAEAFLAREAASPRAGEIRKALEAVQKR